MEWREELRGLLGTNSQGIPLFAGRTAAEILAEKDDGRAFCHVRGRYRWEGRERQGRREGRWLFFDGDSLRFEIIYVDDLPGWICGFNPDSTVDPTAVFSGEWATERSPFVRERALLQIVLGGLHRPEDAAVVLHRLAAAGAGQVQSIRALREGLGISLATARAMVVELFPSG